MIKKNESISNSNSGSENKVNAFSSFNNSFRIHHGQQQEQKISIRSRQNHISTRSLFTLSSSSTGVLNYKSKIESTSTSRNIRNQQARLFSSTTEDFYKVLGVSKNANKGEIKKAYFKLAKKYHPDTNRGDANASDQFKRATAAYEVLSDVKKKEMYDQFGHAGVDPNFQAGGGNPFGQGNPFGGDAQGFNFNDGSFHFSSDSGGGGIDQDGAEELFDMFFGGGSGNRRRRNRGPKRGADLQTHVRLTFKEAVFGSSKKLNLRYQVQDSSSRKTEHKNREVTVETPPGIDNGMNLRLSGEGAEGDPGAPSGNLLVQVVVENDNYFTRDGYDIHTEAPIRIAQAILGGSVEIQSLTGSLEVKIPKGCKTETKLMIRKKGIQHLHGSTKGNHIVHLKIQIPKNVTAKQEQLLREFDSEELESSKGVGGRLAEAAGNAFTKIFGDGKKKNAEKSEKEDLKNEDEDDYDSKKEAAQ